MATEGISGARWWQFALPGGRLQAACDGERLWLRPRGKGESPRAVNLEPLPGRRPLKVALLPPLVRIEQRPLPQIPAAELLAAAEEGILWQQLFPDADPAEDLLGWSRRREPDGDRVLAAFGQRSHLDSLRRALGRDGKAIRFSVPLQPQAWWSPQAEQDAIRCGDSPWLFNPWPPKHLLLLRTVTALSLVAALALTLFSLTAAAPAPAAADPAPSEAAIEQQRSRNEALEQQLRLTRQRLQRRDRSALLVQRQNERLRGLSASMPPGLSVQRLVLEADELSLSATGRRQALFSQLAQDWQTQGAVLRLESVRRTAAGDFAFSAVLSPQAAE